MRWRGVSHVEFAVLDYDDSIAFYDALFGWLGYSSFSSLNMEYLSIYYMTNHVSPHSYIGIQPARTGGKLTHDDQAVGINHIALWARSRGEVDRFHREFLIARSVAVTDEPKEYPQTGPAITPFSSMIRSTGFTGSWRGCRKSLLLARSGRSIARFVVSPGVAPTWRTRCLAWSCRPGEPCRVALGATGSGCRNVSGS